MTKRMLIDAAHPEETRVVIVDGSRVEELDFESRHKRQLRGNVYLAKVTRVEPSLQAAFIEYGGNRHGFLAFSEIHPDYYQLPQEDRLALQRQEEEELAALAEAEEDDEDADDDIDEDENLDPDEDDATDENDEEVAEEQTKVASKRRKRTSRRRYKIQEVIKRGQILLVQAVKEERGNKGAAMTTYLSLAGRYCVLMPNTPRGGGISRKIPNGSDRKRLKKIMDDLDVPQGMGVIVRTAGAKRTKAEITRDYQYLSRLWDEIRDTTMESRAPALIHEEGNLVKRSIRDLYNKDIEEVLVQGEEAYKTAKSFIKMLMPSHAKYVKRYDGDIPLFLRYNAEKQIENSLDATVQLKSGGYLVIHPTEALVSVDVNSGRSTKERNIEKTALKTNLEAAEELARQMRLRDLAGLIVVDFIDMDENRNNRKVESKMKEVLARDRARIQVGRISQFGLMEMSRQRRRRSLLEGSTTVCPHCDGVGRKRTVESSALAAVRALEDFAIRGKAKKIRLKCPPDVALYLLNEKRDLLEDVDNSADVATVVEPDEDLIRPDFVLEVAEKRTDNRKDPLVAIEKEIAKEQREAAKARKAKPEDDTEDEDEADADQAATEDDGEDKPKRRRGRRGGRNRRRKPAEGTADDAAAEESDPDAERVESEDETGAEAPAPKPRSRRRRAAPKRDADATDDAADEAEASESEPEDEAEAPKSRRRSSARRKAPSKASDTAETADDGENEREEAPAPKSRRRRAAPKRDADDDAPAKPKRTRKAPAKAEDNAEDDPKPARKRRAPAKTKAADEDDEAPKPTRRRKAPAKAEDDAPDADAKPKRTRKAPAKAKADEGEARKPARKRRAPAKTKAGKDEADADAPKPTRRRKAPAKAADSAAEPEDEAKPKRARRAPAKASTEPDSDEAPKPARKRRAPAKAEADTSEGAEALPARKRAAPKKAADVEAPAEPHAPAPKRRRKAPARKTADADPQAVPVAELPSEAAPAEPGAPSRRRKAPARKKGGLLDRLMGKS